MLNSNIWLRYLYCNSHLKRCFSPVYMYVSPLPYQTPLRWKEMEQRQKKHRRQTPSPRAKRNQLRPPLPPPRALSTPASRQRRRRRRHPARSSERCKWWRGIPSPSPRATPPSSPLSASLSPRSRNPRSLPLSINQPFPGLSTLRDQEYRVLLFAVSFTFWVFHVEWALFCSMLIFPFSSGFHVIRVVDSPYLLQVVNNF